MLIDDCFLENDAVEYKCGSNANTINQFTCNCMGLCGLKWSTNGSFGDFFFYREFNCPDRFLRSGIYQEIECFLRTCEKSIDDICIKKIGFECKTSKPNKQMANCKCTMNNKRDVLRGRLNTTNIYTFSDDTNKDYFLRSGITEIVRTPCTTKSPQRTTSTTSKSPNDKTQELSTIFKSITETTENVKNVTKPVSATTVSSIQSSSTENYPVITSQRPSTSINDTITLSSPNQTSNTDLITLASTSSENIGVKSSSFSPDSSTVTTDQTMKFTTEIIDVIKNQTIFTPSIDRITEDVTHMQTATPFENISTKLITVSFTEPITEKITKSFTTPSTENITHILVTRQPAYLYQFNWIYFLIALFATFGVFLFISLAVVMIVHYRKKRKKRSRK